MDLLEMEKQIKFYTKSLLDELIDNMVLRVDSIDRDVSSKIVSEINLVKKELEKDKYDDEYVSDKIDLIQKLVAKL